MPRTWKDFDDLEAFKYDRDLRDVEQGDFKPVKEKPVCHCNAYSWPHRLGSGICDGTPQEPESPACPECGSEKVVADSREVGDLFGGTKVWFDRCGTCGYEFNHR